MNTEFIKKIADAGVIASVSSIENAKKMAESGVGAVECADPALAKSIKEALPALVVGCTAEICAGVDFFHGAVWCKSAIAEAKAAGVAVIASVTTPLEASKMAGIGADILDFSEADIAGGIAMLGALSVAVPEAKFIVSGAADPMSYTAIGACIGFSDKSIDTAEDVAAAASAAMYASLGLTLAHVGINAKDEQSAIEISTAYAKLLGIKQKTGNSSCFAGSWVEVMKKPFLGECGHIAIGTKSLVRAIAFYERIGVKFNMDTAKPVAIYFADDIGGFAIHLVQK